MKPTLKQKILGAILLFAILAIMIPLFISPNHTLKHMESMPPQPPAAPNINLKLPPLSQQPSQVVNDDQKPSVLTAVDNKIHQVKQQAAFKALPSDQKALLHWHSSAKQPLIQDDASHNVTPPSAWRLKLGSFSNKHNATKLVDLLKQHHFDAYKLKIKRKKMDLYQVFVGPTVSRLEAKMIRKHLLSQLGMPSILVAVPIKH